MDESTTITLTLQELISSGCIAKSRFRLAHEVEVDVADVSSDEILSSCKNDTHDEPSSNIKNVQLHHLNATKLSLLLAKSFSDHYSSGGLIPKIMNPSDIFIQVKCLSELDVRSPPCSPEDSNKDAELLASEGGSRDDYHGKDQDPPRHSPSLSDSSFDVALEEIFSDEDNETSGPSNQEDKNDRQTASTKNTSAGGESHQEDAKTMMGGAIINNIEHQRDDKDDTKKPTGCFLEDKEILQIPITDVSQFHAIDKDNLDKLTCTLVKAGMQFSHQNQTFLNNYVDVSLADNFPAALEMLGKIIHAIFSNGAEQLLPILRENSMTPEIVEADDLDIPQAKLRRSNDCSLFANLLESGNFPIAICRLLSDMMDIANADTPFTSLQEVISDLEQMALHPEIFLHDPDESYFSSPGLLLFGQRYYGRVHEVSKILGVSTRLEQMATAMDSSDQGCSCKAETIFINGLAGCGKTHLARKAGNFLSSLGGLWIVIEAKFERSTNHQSREVISLLFDKLVGKLVDMKQQNCNSGESRSNEEADSLYAQRATEAIKDAFDTESLVALADFIPSIVHLLDDDELFGDRENSQRDQSVEPSHWKMIILISRLLGSILRLGRFIMICLDDLQWCDSSMLTLIKETIHSVSQNTKEKQHLLFVGTYRDNEVDGAHPLTTNLVDLQRNSYVNVMQIHLSNLSIDDVSDMITTEMRLPRRLIVDLAREVHKKTSGLALYVVELLNLLLRDSTIVYSPLKRRLVWEQDQIKHLPATDDVAGLIASNVSSLPLVSQQVLQVLSCLGTQVDMQLLPMLENYQKGISSSLTSLYEMGILEGEGSPILVFSHDIIQQAIYEEMSLQKRQKLHLDIGELLGNRALLLSSSHGYTRIEAGMDQLFICEGGQTNEDGDDFSSSILSLANLATTQINRAGPDYVTDKTQRMRFAFWNLKSAKECSAKSNFRGAFYYYKSGISFIKDNPWPSEDFQLSLELHEGAAFAQFAVGNADGVVQYASAIIDAEPVKFDQSLTAQNLLIRSMEMQRNYADALAQGLSVLRQLNFGIPSAPSPAIIVQTMEQTSSIASNCNLNHIFRLNQVIPPKQRNILRIVDSVALACWKSASPYLPLVACSTLIYSMQHGICHCEEASTAFAMFGYFRIAFQEKFDDGLQWGNLAISSFENSAGTSSARSRLSVYAFLYFWYISIEETRAKLHETYIVGMRCGDIDSAMFALAIGWMSQFYGGEKLSLLRLKYDDNLKLYTKYRHNNVLHVTVLRKVSLNMLMGITNDDPFDALDGMICNENELLLHARLNNDVQLIEGVHECRFLSAFWMGDFEKALESSTKILSTAASKMPKIQSVYHIFYRGIVLFRLFREGSGQHLLEKGNEVLGKMQLWHKSCKWLENNLLLLEAEYFASKCNRNLAIEKYEASIESASDHGFVHEQGLALECMGKYLSSIVELKEAKRCFQKAHECYIQWGAFGKAEQIQRDHNLDPNEGSFDQCLSNNLKRDRVSEGLDFGSI